MGDSAEMRESQGQRTWENEGKRDWSSMKFDIDGECLRAREFINREWISNYASHGSN